MTIIEVIKKKKSILKYYLVYRLCRQAMEEFESTFHTLVFLSNYAKDNAVTYVTFYILTATNFPSSLTLCITLLFYFSVTEMKEDIVHSNAMLIRSDRKYVRQLK